MVISAAWVTAFSDLLTIMDRIWIQTLFVLINGVGTALLTFFLTPVFGVLGAIAAISSVTLFLLSWLAPVVARPLLEPALPSTPRGWKGAVLRSYAGKGH
jgi:O-antigen/teichoic acid export membrane protein